MLLQTEVSIPSAPTAICHSDELLLLGSCFAENIGKRLVENKFQCDINPFGTLYNPSSVAQALRRLADGTPYDKSDLHYFEGVGWCTWEHHSRFAAEKENDALEKENRRMLSSSDGLKKAKFLIITFGSAWVFRLRETSAENEQKGEEKGIGDKRKNRVVANCHKQPERLFERSLLTVDDIVDEWKPLLERLHKLNPQLQVLFTVSPIRHLRDGAHSNQLSKATLLLAVQRMIDECEKDLSLLYFPAYEIMLDELRDYRFYADDMTHPSALAEQYIWERFGDTFFNAETKQIIKEWEEVCRALNHRPFRPDSEEHKRFIRQTLLKIEAIRKKMPYFEVEKEIAQCHTILNR